MRCPASSDFWQDESKHRDPIWVAHLATCAHCRQEASRVAQLQQSLAALPKLDVPPTVRTRYTDLAVGVGTQRYRCAETLPLLEAWRENALDAVRAFLVEDHLLECARCAEALAQSEQLGLLLRGLPQLTPPASIAERLTQAREPWWRRWLMPAPAPSWQWGSLLRYGGATMAAGVMLAVLLLHPGAQVMTARKGHVAPPTYGIRLPAPAQAGPENAEIIPDAAGTTEENAPNDNSATVDIASARQAENPQADARPFAVDEVVFERDAPRAPAAKSLPRTMSLVGPAAAEIIRSHVSSPVIPTVSTDATDAFVPPSLAANDQPADNPSASAQDAMRRLAREDDLASSEEALSDVQIAAAPRRPELSPATVMNNSAMATPADELNRAFSREQKQWATPKLTPIVVRNDHQTGHGDLRIVIK